MTQKTIRFSLVSLLVSVAFGGCNEGRVHIFDASQNAGTTADPTGGTQGQGGIPSRTGGAVTGGQVSGGAGGSGGSRTGGGSGGRSTGGVGGTLTGGQVKGGAGGAMTGGQATGGAGASGGTVPSGGSGGRSTGGVSGTTTTGGQATGGTAATGGTTGTTGVGGSGGQTAGAGGKTTTTGGQVTGGSSGTDDAGSGGSGGQGTDAADSGGSGGQATGGTGGSTTCPVLNQTKSSRAAHSSGFSGSYETDYSTLYNVACTTVTECANACVKVGGTPQSCAASECIHSTTDYCLPPTYWHGFDLLRIEGGTIDSSAAIIMVYNPYRDSLLAHDFQFEIPAGAKILGIVMSINRSADMEDAVADYQVKLVRDGATAQGLDRADTKAWSMSFQYVNHGGPTDLWGTAWTPADVNATGFGVALTPMYLMTGGNGRAYVDFIRATVYYSLPCK